MGTVEALAVIGLVLVEAVTDRVSIWMALSLVLVAALGLVIGAHLPD
jgi:hypothetical protein